MDEEGALDADAAGDPADGDLMIEPAVADQLIRLAEMTRNLKGNGLDEGASTRLLVHAGKLIAKGIPARAACTGAIAAALTDDPDMLRAVNELASSLF